MEILVRVKNSAILHPSNCIIQLVIMVLNENVCAIGMDSIFSVHLYNEELDYFVLAGRYGLLSSGFYNTTLTSS